jgi:hypothetical protein
MQVYGTVIKGPVQRTVARFFDDKGVIDTTVLHELFPAKKAGAQLLFYYMTSLSETYFPNR